MKHIRTDAQFEKFLDSLWESDTLEEHIGSYMFKGYRFQISKFGQSTSQRVSDVYKRRRAKGQCIMCGKKVVKKNKRTGKFYRLCDMHRKKIDKKK